MKKKFLFLLFFVTLFVLGWYNVLRRVKPEPGVVFAGVKYRGAGEVFLWHNKDSDPLIPTRLFAMEMYQGDYSYLPALQKLVTGDDSNPATFMLRTGLSHLYFNGGEVDEGFMNEFRDGFLKHGVSIMKVERRFSFGPPCPMIGAVHANDGSFQLEIIPPPLVEFEEPLDVAIFQPIRMTKGMFAGKTIMPVLTLNPVNLTCMPVIEVLASAN